MAKSFYMLLNGYLLVAVLLTFFAPLVGVNPAALTAVHNHLYFGDPQPAHPHTQHFHATESYSHSNMSLTELLARFQDGIALLPDQTIQTLGVFYLALLLLSTTVACLSHHHGFPIAARQLLITPLFLPQPDTPPRA